MSLANRIYWMCRTWYWRSRFVEAMSKALERRTTVENYLFACATGKKPLPDAIKCRSLALYLGDPTLKEKP